MTKNAKKIRRRAIKRAEAWLRARESPRFHMFLIVSATGAAAFFFSFLMLNTGLHIMWIRYPLAVGLAYLVFLALLRVWLSYEESRKSPLTFENAWDAGDGAVEVSDAVIGEMDAVGSSPDSAGDVAGALDPDEWTFVIIALAAVCGVFLAVLYVVWTAPVLLAEVLVDGLVMSRLYKKLKIADQSFWMFGVLRRTWLPALLVAVFFAIIGFIMQQIAPDAISIGPVISHVVGKYS